MHLMRHAKSSKNAGFPGPRRSVHLPAKVASCAEKIKRCKWFNELAETSAKTSD
jgi:hypothetical protein